MLSDNQNQPSLPTQQDQQPLPQPYLLPQQLSQVQHPGQQLPKVHGKMTLPVLIIVLTAGVLVFTTIVLALIIVLMIALNS